MRADDRKRRGGRMSNIVKRIGWTILLIMYFTALVVLYKGVEGVMSEIIAFIAITIVCIPVILLII